MVSTRPFISKFSSPFIHHLVTVPRALIAIGINVAFVFYYYYYYYFTPHCCVCLWFFIGGWMTANLLWSPRLLIFLLYFAMLWCGWFWFFFWFLILSVFYSKCSELFQIHRLELVSPSTLYSTIHFFSSLAMFKYLPISTFSFIFILWPTGRPVSQPAGQPTNTAISTRRQVIFFFNQHGVWLSGRD